MIKKPDYQLRFDLVLPEEDGQGTFILPEEARLREETARRAFEAETGERPAWYEEYEKLRAGGWPFRVAMYIAWAAVPKKHRFPRSLDEMASLMGLNSPRAIYVWRQRNQAIDEQVTMAQNAIFFPARADVIDALIESASVPDYRHAPDRRTYLQVTGDLADEVNVKVQPGENERLKGMTNEQLAEVERILRGEPSTDLRADAVRNKRTGADAVRPNKRTGTDDRSMKPEGEGEGDAGDE